MFFFTATKSVIRSCCYEVALNNFISFTVFTIFTDNFGQQPQNSPPRTSTRTSARFVFSQLLHPVTTSNFELTGTNTTSNFELTGARILFKTQAQDTTGGCGMRGCQHVKRLTNSPALQKVIVSNSHSDRFTQTCFHVVVALPGVVKSKPEQTQFKLNSNLKDTAIQRIRAHHSKKGCLSLGK